MRRSISFAVFTPSRCFCPLYHWPCSVCYRLDQSTNNLLAACASRHFGDQDTNKDHDSGFAEPDQWRFTPSILDTNSFAFASFANHHSNDFASTPGGTNTVYHNNQAGDLHTPGVGFHLGTPLSVSNTAGQSDTTAPIDMHGFNTHLLHSQPFQNNNRFTPQQSYAPSSFMHQDSGYEPMEAAGHAMAPPRPSVDDELSRESTFVAFATRHSDNVRPRPVPAMDRYLM